ncbi:hypothetical protein [Pontibacter sp. HSC-36F09]|uniref:hypothetical protein n=1 Tax=Pontibacter sp. HSC-36F09 TaxID=2910966 RepID=UPI0020A20C92|nr:hypothetical protein [Pontibacter sp. HSC-36F09]MCP2043065.1 hypothetical protein [Pontibacter sp. HSC-36F09]
MKPLLLISLLCTVLIYPSLGQINKYRSDRVAITSKVEGTNNWKDWSPYLVSDALIVIDQENKKIIIYNPHGEVSYDIIRTPKITQSSNDNKVTTLESVNDKGQKCIFALVGKTLSDVNEIYIQEGEIRCVYNISKNLN